MVVGPRSLASIGIILLVLAFGGGLVVAAQPVTVEITLNAYDFFFTQPGVTGNNPTLVVMSGQTVIVTLQNEGAKLHEFFVLTQVEYDGYVNALRKGQKAEEPLPAFKNASVEDVAPQESKTGTFVVGEPGTYVYACLSKDGPAPLLHAHQGMFGTFQVNQGGIAGLATRLTAWLTNMPGIYLFQAYILISIIILAARARHST